MKLLRNKSNCKLRDLITWHLKTFHGKFVALSLIAGLIYLPIWLSVLCKITFIDGKSTILLNIGFLYLGITRLWRQRTLFTGNSALGDDRFIGYCLILGGIISFPFCLDSSSLQAFVTMVILAGVFTSSFGASIFFCYPLALSMLFASIYPDWAFLSNFIFQLLTGPGFLERIMAQLGSNTLNMIGQSAAASGQYVNLPSGSVLVGSGCSGFDMAFSIAGCSILLGLFLNQHWFRITFAVLIGIGLALILNVPRIILLTFASVYWGEGSFEFWHGAWGGQIFSGLLFTIYYYIVMTIYKKKTVKLTS